MTPPIHQLADLPAAPDEDEVPPELARIIIALAERQARKDFAARSTTFERRP